MNDKVSVNDNDVYQSVSFLQDLVSRVYGVQLKQRGGEDPKSIRRPMLRNKKYGET